MASSSDACWSVRNEMKMILRLKNMSKSITANTSDSGEEADNTRWFLKGDKSTSLWSSTVNHVEVDCTHDQEHGRK